jgi:hypothetical protein
MPLVPSLLAPALAATPEVPPTPFPAADADLATCERALVARLGDAGPDEARALDRVLAAWIARAARPPVPPEAIRWTADGRLDRSTSAEWDLAGEGAGCAAELGAVPPTPTTVRTVATFHLEGGAPPGPDARLILEVGGRHAWTLSGAALAEGVTVSWDGRPGFRWRFEGLASPTAVRDAGPTDFSTDPEPVARWSFVLSARERAELTAAERSWNAEIPLVTPALGPCHWTPRPLGVPVFERTLIVERDGSRVVIGAPAPVSMIDRLEAGDWNRCDAPRVLERWRARER